MRVLKSILVSFLGAAAQSAVAATVPFSFGEVGVDCEARDGWTVSLAREVAADGAEIAVVTLDSPEAKTPPKT